MGETMFARPDEAENLNIERYDKRRARMVALLIFAFCASSMLIASARAHEPITTRVRFNKELIRVLQHSCLGCHREGGIAPWSLVTYDEARPWAKAIKEEILEKRMPPWRAMKGYGEFRNAPQLTQREIDLIVNWVEGGAPKGDDKDLPAGPLYSTDWQLGKPDLVLKAERPLKIASDEDGRRAITLPTDFKQDRWLTAIDLMADKGSVVHCATLYLDTGVKKASADSSLVLGTWSPGQKSVALPDGVAQLVPAGAKLSVEIHYRGAGEEVEDRSAVGLYFAKALPSKRVQEISLSGADANVPAGAGLHKFKTSIEITSDTEAVAIRPAVNPLLVSLQATAYRPDGTQEILIWVRGYQYDWRTTYYYKQPVILSKGTRVEVVAYFDNSDANRNNPNSPPKQVRWPDLSPDPLCALVITQSQSPERAGSR
jgi:hypothetical protein